MVCCRNRKSSTEKFSFVSRAFEGLYDKCASYNLRYCTLRVGHRGDKNLTNAAKDLMILLCFLLANSVVFLNIATRIAFHVYLLIKETAFWFKRRLLKSESTELITFNNFLE